VVGLGLVLGFEALELVASSTSSNFRFAPTPLSSEAASDLGFFVTTGELCDALRYD
jgi:hypothetical protein